MIAFRVFWANIVLCRFVVVMPLPRGANETVRTVFFLVQYGKSGSSTLRTALNSRAAYHKFSFGANTRHTKRWYGHSSYFGNACKDIKVGMRHQELPHNWYIQTKDTECARRALEQIRNQEKLHSQVLVKPPVVGLTPFQNLEALSTTDVPLLNMIMQVRHPLDQLVSHYNYFCMACKEKGKFCGTMVDVGCGPGTGKQNQTALIQGVKQNWAGENPRLPSIVQWARLWGNYLTRQLSPQSIELLDGGWYPSVRSSGYTHEVTVEVARGAWRTVSSAREFVCIMVLEDTWRYRKLAAWLGEQNPNFFRDALGMRADFVVNRGTRSSVVEQFGTQQLDALHSILAPDLWLYGKIAQKNASLCKRSIS